VFVEVQSIIKVILIEGLVERNLRAVHHRIKAGKIIVRGGVPVHINRVRVVPAPEPDLYRYLLRGAVPDSDVHARYAVFYCGAVYVDRGVVVFPRETYIRSRGIFTERYPVSPVAGLRKAFRPRALVACKRGKIRRLGWVSVQFAVYDLFPVEPAGIVTLIAAEVRPVPVQPLNAWLGLDGTARVMAPLSTV
jgi:hypothetical protein